MSALKSSIIKIIASGRNGRIKSRVECDFALISDFSFLKKSFPSKKIIGRLNEYVRIERSTTFKSSKIPKKVCRKIIWAM